MILLPRMILAPRMILVGMLALAAGLTVVLPALPAAAHAVLVSSTPADGTRLNAAPNAVQLVFDENVQLPANSATVLAVDGRRVDAGDAQADGGTIRIPLRVDLPRGTYTASWRVVSADGHVVTGAISFGVGVDPVVPGVNQSTPTDPLSVLSAVALGLIYLGVVLGIGVILAGRTLWPATLTDAPVRIAVRIGWGLLLGGTVIRLVLAGAIDTGSGLAGVKDLTGWSTALSGTTGIAGLLRLLICLAAVPLVRNPSRRGPVRELAAALAGLGVLITVAIDGHASVGDDAVIAVIAAVAHLAAMAFWLGGLVVLFAVVLPGTGPTSDQPDPTQLNRWSRLAFFAVGVLIVSGEYQALRQLHPVDSLFRTSYGLVLLLKLALVAGALVAATRAQRVLRRRTDPIGEPRAPNSGLRLRRQIGLESALLAAVLVTTTVLVALPPARTSYGPGRSLTAPLGPDTVRVTVDTTRTGVQQIRVTALDADRRPVRASSVSGHLSSSAVPALPASFTRQGDDWTSRVAVPLAGSWTLTLTVGLDAAHAYTTSAAYRVW